jgi:AraC-like DNA-binding protein
MKAPGHLRIEEVKLLPGHEWVDQSPAWRFVHLSKGAAYWLDRAKPRSMTEGELLVLAPGLYAVVRASQINEVMLHGFKFAPDLLCGFFTLAERRFFENGGVAAGEVVQFLPSTHPITQRLAFLVGQRAPHRELTERAEVLGLVAAYFGEGIPRNKPATLANSAHIRFEQIILQMPDLEIIHHTPEQLAHLCGCSPRHFNRLFWQHFGESPRARQTEMRLLKARQLLCDTDENIVQIALDSGYRSLSLFNSLFKRRFGVSPSECRPKAPA